MRFSFTITLPILMFLASLFHQTHAQPARNCMIGDRIAIFYPENFQASLTLPSMALQSEPVETGDLPEQWILRPHFRTQGKKQVVEFYAGRDISYYGTGEVTGPLLRNGLTVTLWNTDNFNYKYDSLRLYQSHPWVMGVRRDGTAFGLIADHSYRQKITTRDTIRFESEGPAFRVIVMERESPQELMKALGELTGCMPLPPLWALGYQQCRWSYTSASKVKEIANEFRSRHIPCDVIWMDIDYMEGFRIFTFNNDSFPNPKELNQYLHHNQFKSVWMIDPGVKIDKNYSVFQSGKRGKHWVLNQKRKPYTGDVWPGPCHFPDFTRPQTQQWWAGLYKDFMATGIDGVWNDMNEPAVFNGPDKTMPLDNIHRGGGILPKGLHERYHNLYGLLMVRSSREGLLAVTPEKRPFILSRSNFLGGHRYAATWTGDNASTWEHLKLSIPMSLNLSLSGQPFNGPDIGGFSENPSPELFGHWIALGAFYPFARGHACQGTIDKEPWEFGPEVENAARIAMNRRYRLLPYLYTLFHEASQTNMPIMRPVFFSDPKDIRLRKEQQAFLLGGDLLVVPQWGRNIAKPLCFKQTITLDGELATDKYQPILYQRDGSIIPVGRKIESTAQYHTDSLQLFIVPDLEGKAQGTLYSDNGDGFGFENGEYESILFEAIQENNTIRLKTSQMSGKHRNQERKIQLLIFNSDRMVKTGWLCGTEIQIDLNQVE